MFNEWDIQALRGVGNAELRFDEGNSVRVLFGSNGVGKTKCLEAIFQSLLLGNKNFSSEFGSHGYQPGWQVMATATVENGLIFSAKKEASLLIQNSHGSKHETPVIFLGASGRSKIFAAANSVELIGTFSDRKRKYFQDLMSAIVNGAMSDIGMTTNTQSWFMSRAASNNPYQKSADNRSIEIKAVLDILNLIDARIDPSQLQIDGAGRVSLLIDNVYRELQQLSSGFASLVKLVQAIISGYANFTNESNLTHVHGVVLIDEIESHLHAEWQSKIVPILKRSFPNTIFFIATHSPIVLSQLEQGEAYLLHRDEDGVVRTTEIDSPNKRGFLDVLESGFGIDLNALKRESMLRDDQVDAKSKLLDLLKSKGS